MQIGNLSRKPSSVLKAIHDSYIYEILGERIDEIPEKKEKITEKNLENTEKTAEVVIGKERDIPHKFAQCCQPTPASKKIIGIIGHGQVTIHKFDCPEVEKTDIDRRITARWSTDSEKQTLTLKIEVQFRDKK